MSTDYFLAPALVQLRAEVNDLFPHRDKSSDGWIGDPSHAARKSEHNPCWACVGRLRGIVRALDTDVDDGDPARDLRRMILNATIGDPRVWYVISNGVIYSRTHGWEARKYIGLNGHFHHVHVSLLDTGNMDTRRWFDPAPVKVKPLPVDLSVVATAFARYLDGTPNTGKQLHVARMQNVLNQHGHKLKVDGLVGAKTVRAAAAEERRVGGTGRPRVPDATMLRQLVAPKYRMVA